jgi:hypothetical protein
MTQAQLLDEVEDILRTMPTREAFGQHRDEIVPWLGRAAAVIKRWDPNQAPFVASAIREIHSLDRLPNISGFSTLTTLLSQARADLRMEVGLLSVVVPQRDLPSIKSCSDCRAHQVALEDVCQGPEANIEEVLHPTVGQREADHRLGLLGDGRLGRVTPQAGTWKTQKPWMVDRVWRRHDRVTRTNVRLERDADVGYRSPAGV